MIHKTLFTLVLFLLWAGPTLAASHQDHGKSKPNIIIILADDLGWNDLSSYGNGYIETPNIDRLVRGGLKFTDAYSAGPTCAPSRACLLSGMNCGSHGIFRVNKGDNKPADKQRLRAPKNAKKLPLEIVTLADSMQAAGYATGCFGKWHLGYKEPEYHPSKRGFTHAVNMRQPSGKSRYFYPNFSTIPEMKIEDGKYHPELLTDYAIEFMDDHKDTPFFLYLPYFNVHGPYEAPQKTIEKYESKGSIKPSDEPVYAAMVEELDNSVGRIIDKLRSLDLEDSIVIFSSDNGAPEGRDNLPLRGGKGQLYEGGIRVPMVVRWQGVVSPGSTTSIPVNQLDLYPTCLDIANYEAPNESELDGASLLNILTGDDFSRGNHECLYWHYPTYQKWNKAKQEWYVQPQSAIRKGEFKLIDQMDSEQLELYNLSDDIEEKNNLAETMPEKVKELKALLDSWRTESKVPMPVEK